MASHFGRAVSITKSGKRGFLEIDDDELEDVLIRPDIGDRPIAIISIAGSLKTGKSFILNFLLRYLRNRGWENDSWMGTDDTSADDGMTWSGGAQATTTGIIIWDEVFYVPDASGREVAVLIMDTQGLFYDETIEENNVKLFTVSAFMSSVQVLNVMGRIEERDLGNLQLCVEFATKAAQQSEAQFKLQKLLFLVRDYPFALEYGLEAGNKYLEEVLLPRSGLHQLTEIRSHLRSSFSNLCCFLMPHPGSKVERKKFEGKNKEIGEEFLKEVPNFVESLLHPKNLLAKISNGKLVTAMEIRNLILACDRIFVEGKLPPIETLLEATTKAHYETHYQTCMKKYSEGIKDILVSESYIDESILKDIHQNAMKYAMDSFDSTLKVGSAEMRKKYRDNLTQSCEEKYDNMLKSNNNNQEKILSDLEKIRIGRQIQYEKKMKEVLIGGPIEDSEFEQHHRSFMEEAIIDFKKRSEHEKYEKFRQGHELQLIDDISKYFDKERKENGKRNDVEKKRRMEKEQAEVENIHYNLLDVYSKSLREIFTAQSTPAKQLEEHHIECIETVKVQYTSQTAMYEWLPGDSWNKLKNDMIGVYKREKKSNQDKIQKEQELEEEKDKLELHKITEQSKLDYEKKLETGPPPPYVAEQPCQETLPKAGLGKLQPAGHIRPTATFHPSSEQEDFVYDDENQPHDPPPSIADTEIEQDFLVCSSSIVGEETMQESEKPTTIPSFLPRQRDEFIDNSFNPFSFTVGRNGCVVKTPYAEIIFPCDAVDEKIEITVRPDYYRLKEKLIDDSRIYVSPEIFFESKDEMTFKNEVTIYLEVMYSAIDPDDPLILNVERIEDGVVEKYLKLEHGQGTKAEFKVKAFCGFCISALKSVYPKAKRHFYSIICLRQPPKETPTHHHVHWYIFDRCEIEVRSKSASIKDLGFYTLGLPESFAVKYGRNIRLRFQSNRKVRIASRKVELVQFWGDPLSRDEKFTIDGNKIDLSGGEDDEEPVIKYTITEIDASNEETSVVLDNSVPFSWLVPAYKTEFVMKGDNNVGVQNTYYEHTRMEIPAKQTPHSGQVAQNPNEGNAVDAVYQGQSCDIQERRFNQCPAGGAIGGHNPDDHRRNARINYGSMPSQRYNPTSQGQLTSDDRAHSSQGQNVVGYNSTETVDYKNNEEHLHSNQHQLPGNRSKDFENEQQMGEPSGQRIPKLSDSKSSGGSRKKEKGKKGWKSYLRKK